MKIYPSIDGSRNAPVVPCVAFEKKDGSQIRGEWSRKRGWYKWGTRRRLFDATDPEYGKAIEIFLNKYGDSIPKALVDDLGQKKVESFIAFGEFFGPSSFSGRHNFEEDHDVVLFDVSVHKRGFVLPSDFVRLFGNLGAASVVYEGLFDQEFIEAVRNGEYVGDAEGVVAKGTLPGKKGKEQHSFWMRKVKTNWWLNELKVRAESDSSLLKELEDNLRESCIL
jgi:hypothetical protein